MARLRLGVVLLVPPPVLHEINGLRRACGDPTLDRVAPHITLVPPVNVSEQRVSEALTSLRRGAASVEPFELMLGPVTSFAPDSPTLYLAVGGDPDAISALHRLRDTVFEPPLHRELSWPFVAHVTLADDIGEERIDAAVRALATYETVVGFRSVQLLCERRDASGPHWSPFADYRFGPPIAVARGSLPLELWLSRDPDPEASALLAREDQPIPDDGQSMLAVTARRRDELVGVAWGGAHDLAAITVEPEHRRQGIARHLRARFAAESPIDVDQDRSQT